MVKTIPAIPGKVSVASKVARSANSELRIIARSSRLDDIDQLLDSGANIVVQPEFEASAQITKHALVSMGSSSEQILSSLNSLRESGHKLFKPDFVPEPFIDFSHDELYGVWYVYEDKPETLEALDLRRKTGITVLAINGHGGLLPHPDGSVSLKKGDKIYVSGNEFQIYKFESSYDVSPEIREVSIDANR